MIKCISLLLILMFSSILFSCSKENKSEKAAEEMQKFVANISNYAKDIDGDFIIIPQNGIELAFNSCDTTEGLNTAYISAINGFGVEELFYNGSYAPDKERLAMLRILRSANKIMVAEYISDNKNIADAVTRNYNEGFICFPRVSSNYDYLEIPDTAIRQNINDITTLKEAQNYLYLISSDNYSSKNEMINAISATSFDIVIMDLFFDEVAFTSSEINLLKTKANGGKRLIIAYMNIGSAEKFRYYFKSSWGLYHPSWLKRKYEGYKDEFWVKFWETEWQDIIYGNENSYTKKIIEAGFDGAYLDNIEAYYFLFYRN
jgi:cysteinyl-tRNA synthetase